MSARSNIPVWCPTPDELDAIRERAARHTPESGPRDRGQLLAYVDFLVNELDTAQRALGGDSA